eukprot:718977-Pleurochrysis_carterae.AAC.1
MTVRLAEGVEIGGSFPCVTRLLSRVAAQPVLGLPVKNGPRWSLQCELNPPMRTHAGRKRQWFRGYTPLIVFPHRLTSSLPVGGISRLPACAAVYVAPVACPLLCRLLVLRPHHCLCLIWVLLFSFPSVKFSLFRRFPFPPRIHASEEV